MKNLIWVVCLSAMLAACEKDEGYLRAETLTVASETRLGRNWAGGLSPYLVVKQGDNEWQKFGEPIEGFEFEEGYECVLRVKVFEIKNPPQDASSLRYALDKMISKTRKDSEGLPPDATLPE